jgi:hypothetical protein
MLLMHDYTNIILLSLGIAFEKPWLQELPPSTIFLVKSTQPISSVNIGDIVKSGISFWKGDTMDIIDHDPPTSASPG